MTSKAHPSPHLHGDSSAAASPQGLADRRELAVIAVERTRMPMVVCDPRQADMPMVLANQAFLHLTGYGAEEVIGRNCRMLQGPETSAEAVAQIRRALEEQRELSVELLNYRKDGSCFWNQLHLSPIFDDQGDLLYVFGSQIDVTERRQARQMEQAEHHLLKEVDHRAKNVLALVQGIVRLSRAETTAAYKLAVQGRVQALGHAHEILAANGWRGAPLELLVHTEVDALGSSRVSVEGPAVTVPAEMVQPLALFLHELSTNAVTHGALSTPSGAVQVAWERRAEDGRVVFRWVERGGPPPQQERPSGFGTFLITAVVQRQLRGDLDMDWSPDGLTVNLVLPPSDAAQDLARTSS